MSQTKKSQDVIADRSRWMHSTLMTAGIFSIVWGAGIVLFPDVASRWIAVSSPWHPLLWQYTGLLTMTLGVGYAIASQAPLRHWPIVLVGLVGKTLGPMAAVWVVASGQLPWSAGVTVVMIDLLWILPFALILRTAFIGWQLEDGRRVYEEAAQVLLETIQTNSGETLAAMSHRAPLLMAFLRHSGCPFCREAAADLSRERAIFESLGVRLALVHMGDERRGEKFFESYGLADMPRVSDPERTLYRAFKLRRGRLRQLLGIRVWRRAISAALRGHWPGALQGDSFQMPGLFLVRNGEIVRTFRYETAADRPDYAEFVCGLSANEDSQSAVCA